MDPNSYPERQNFIPDGKVWHRKNRRGVGTTPTLVARRLILLHPCNALFLSCSYFVANGRVVTAIIIKILKKQKYNITQCYSQIFAKLYTNSTVTNCAFILFKTPEIWLNINVLVMAYAIISKLLILACGRPKEFVQRFPKMSCPILKIFWWPFLVGLFENCKKITATNYRRQRRADQQRLAAAAPTNCRRRRRRCGMRIRPAW